MSRNLLLLDEIDSIAILTFNDPGRANAMSVAMAEEFLEVVQELADRRDLRALILHGTGSTFSAGGDLDMLRDHSEGVHGEGRRLRTVAAMRHYYERFLSLLRIPVPVIAAINGPAVGAGLCVALACDMRLVAQEATLGFTFTRLGLHPGLGATYFLPRIVGPERAFMLLATGRIVDGATAVRLGLALEAHPRAQLLEAALTLARDVAHSSPLAVRQVKANLRRALQRDLPTALQAEAEAQSHNYASGEVIEGIRALRQKRLPRFSS
jgi:enoyl-CoA hydratase/carnithine racemase